MFGKAVKQKNNVPALISQLKLGGLQDWLSVILVFLSLMIAVLSIEQAHWSSFVPSLILTLALAVLATSLMIVIRLWNKVTYILMVVLGLLVMVWRSSGTISRADGQSALNAWWQTVTNALPSENSIYFAMFLIIVTWLIGFVSVWFVLKKRNVWVAVFLGTVMLLVNINNLPYNYYYFFPLYLFISLLLIFQVNLTKQKEVLKNSGDRKPFHNVMYLVAAVFFIVILIVNAAWFSPELPVEQMGLKLDTSSLHNVDPAKNWFNIFASIQSKWPWMESKNQAKLLFETPLEEGESIHYIVTSDKPAYWLTRRYDTYNAWGWTSNTTVDETVSAGTAVVGEELNHLSYIVENRIKTDVIITTGLFVKADIPVSLKTVPFDQTDTNNGADIIATVSPWVLGPYQRYTVVTNIPSFTTEELTAAKGAYPDWVIQRYLQLPDTFPQHVRTLSDDLTKDAPTAYEKLTAIKKYLDKFLYNQKALAPSGTEDGVALFLYSTQKGNCLSFASSMVVMLRSVGIPARLCTGYLQGDLDKKTGKYIVRSRHYHAWAEVYFPGYGWIEFETTPDSGTGGNVEPADDNASFIFTDELPPWMQEDELLQDEGLTGTGDYVPVRHSSKIWILFVVLGALFFIAVTARTVFGMWVGQLKRINNPSEVYARMCYLATLSKAGPSAQETPLEYSMRLATVLPGYDDYISNITQSYINVRYSPRKEMTNDYERSQLQKSWVEVCSSLVRRRMEAKKWFLMRILLRLD
jgi:transglutaminase-like putative cysteine protease